AAPSWSIRRNQRRQEVPRQQREPERRKRTCDPGAQLACGVEEVSTTIGVSGAPPNGQPPLTSLTANNLDRRHGSRFLSYGSDDDRWLVTTTGRVQSRISDHALCSSRTNTISLPRNC